MPRSLIDRTGLIAIGTTVLIFLLHFFQIVNFRELDAVDLRFRIRGPQAANPKITVVTIDDPSLAAVGAWPWPRGVHGSFLNVISRYQPESIFLDILFTEQSPNPEEDEKLAQALKAVGNGVLAFYYVTEKPFEANFPTEVLRKEAAGLGFVNATRDADGRIRRIKAFVKSEQETFYTPSLTLIGDNEKSLPLDRDQHFWVNYPGGPSVYQQVSFGEVIALAGLNQEERLRNLFSGKMVLIGHAATGTSDLITTPFSTQEPGVFLHAGALHTLLSGKTLKPVSPILTLLILLVLCGIAAFGTQKLETVYGLLLSLGLSVLYILINFILFVGLGVILPFVVPLIGILLSYGLVLYIKHLEQQMHREIVEKEMEAAFEIQDKFLSHQFPVSESLDIAVECRFCKQVGGDLYDWVDLGDNRVGICIGDVSGKGMPAAIYMAKALGDFKSIDKRNMRPGEVCEVLNQRLTVTESTTMFLTFLYVVIDLAQNKMTYASAGHEPIVFFQKKTREAFLLKNAQGTPLGVFEGMAYETAEISFEQGDAFILVSDGVKELRNRKGQEFGLERLKSAVQEQGSASLSAKKLSDSIYKILEKHQEETPPHDDRTMLCVLRT